MAAVDEKWTSRQKIDAATMNRASYAPIQTLANPPSMRAAGMSNDNVTGEVPITWKQFSTVGGFTSSNRRDFKPPLAGLYWVTCTATMTTPGNWNGLTSTGTLLIQVGTTDGSSTPTILKGFTSTKVKGSYQSVHTSGLMFLNARQTIWTSIQSYGGTWTKAKSGNPDEALSSFSAVLISPDATG
ncbi:hypothetical protein AB0O76_40580 [Streptomyces sp. NPDC086554]|uniref:hypothetical protein n=1 Tax=Streptomyces sp. NPDC086554 TaxID=3154864 RepID=UPI00343376C0